MSDTKGFTLIELLVVISIIGILSSVVVTSLSEARLKAQYAHAQADMRNIASAVVVAGGERGSYLGQITGNWCSHCQCRISGGGAQGSACFNTMSTSMGLIDASSDYVFAISQIQIDPWGSPYAFDENEHEYPHDLCRRDIIWSAGPDMIHHNSDDYLYFLPFRDPACY